MSHLDTAFKLGAAQAQHDFQAELHKSAAPASADFQSQLNALALAPGEEITRSAPMARTMPGENRPPAGMVARSSGPGQTIGSGSLTGGKLRTPNVGLSAPSRPTIEAPTAVAGIQRPGTTQPSAALASMGMGQRGQVANTPTGRGAPQVSPAVAAGPINAPTGGGGAVAGLKTPSWARRPA